MNLTEVRLTDIRNYDQNPRYISPLAIEKVRKSIEDFGYNQPLVLTHDNVIIAGHTRYNALLQINRDTGDFSTVKCLVATHLDEAKAKQYRIVDNQVGEISQWDFTKLGIELESLDGFNYLDYGPIEDFTVEETVIDDIPDDLPPTGMIKFSFGDLRFEVTEADYHDWCSSIARESGVPMIDQVKTLLRLTGNRAGYTEAEL